MPFIRFIGEPLALAAICDHPEVSCQVIAEHPHSLGIAVILSVAENPAFSQSDLTRMLSPFRADAFYFEQMPNIRLALFDMDSTLIQAEVIDELAREAGIVDQVAALTESAMCGEIDFKESFRKRMQLLKGLPAESLETIASRLPLMPGGPSLMSALKAAGSECWLVSGGFNYFAKRIVALLGMDGFTANELPLCGGQITGEVEEPIVDAQVKAQRLTELKQALKLSKAQCLAVGDGANDLLMLAEAGIGVAFRAKPAVQAQAAYSVRFGDLADLAWLLGI